MSTDFPVELKQAYLDKAIRLKILAEDINESFILGSGSGGQKLNKTASCVQLKHGPSKITIQCQASREQAKNRLHAYRMLIDKIEEQVDWRNSNKAKKINKLKKQKSRRTRRSKQPGRDGPSDHP